MRLSPIIFLSVQFLIFSNSGFSQNRIRPELLEVPEIQSSWDDLTDGVTTQEDWNKRKVILRQRFLDLIRDQYKPEKPPLDLKVHESVYIEGIYQRQLISYQVEADERAYAYLGIPLNISGKISFVTFFHIKFPLTS